MEEFWYVYIIECKNGTYYTGHTSDIKRRILEHDSGKVHFTKDKRPVTLVSFITFNNKYKALDFERYLKSGSGIAFRNRHLV